MKPYFAEYIPVEGEIKEGDSYINTEVKPGEKLFGKIYVGLPLVLKNGYLGKGYKDKDYFKKYMRKVKLFLCSRDIQVGDKVKNIFGYASFNKEGIYESNSDLADTCYIETKQGIEQCVKSHWTKIIGEISPDATWVQRGDEFDEDEVEEWQYTNKGWYLPVGLSSIKGLPAKYKVKGPCGHFH